MKQIYDYVEVMFRELPQTEQVLEIKASILESMEAKYHDAIKNGKTDAEAIGLVIGEFGSIDDIKEALDIETEAVNTVSSSDLTNYLDFLPRFALGIGTGVAAIMTMVGLVSLVDGTARESIVTIGFMLVVGMAVVGFIIVGMRLDSLKDHLKGKDLGLSRRTVDAYIEKRSRTMALSIAAGVGFIFIGIVLSYAIGERELVSGGYDISGAMMLWCAAIGVFIIINGAVPVGSARDLIKESEETGETKREDQVLGLVMALTALVFVLLGQWDGSLYRVLWVMFPANVVIVKLLQTVFRKK